MNDLSTLLHDAFDDVAAPSDLARKARAGGQRRRRRALVATSAASASGVAIAGIAGVALLNQTHPAAKLGAIQPAASVAATTAAATTAPAAALPDPSDFVIVSKETVTGDGPSTTWFDIATGDVHETQYAADGTTAVADDVQTVDTDHTLTITNIDRKAQTYWRSVTKEPADWNSPEAGTLPQVDVDTAPSTVKGLVDSGALVDDGSDKVDGRDTFAAHLAKPGGGDPSKVWIDASTYQVVRVVYGEGEGAPTTADVTWLPRTPENLKLLGTDLPDGYTRKSPQPSAVAVVPPPSK